MNLEKENLKEPWIHSEKDKNVLILRMNRPKVLNALNREVINSIANEMELAETDDSIRAILLSGHERAWAAGADITEMSNADATEMKKRDQFAQWDRIRKIKKPIIAAVSGWALGGGCELMMLCDIIIASESAQFGQPEINIGVIPGAGGTQRLTRAIGKAAAMDIILNGRFFTAKEALTYGLISRVVPKEHWFDEALKTAHQLCQKPPMAVRAAKESVLKSFETPLQEGLLFERQNFYSLFDTNDQKEGMNAFLEKRAPNFTGK